MYTAQFDYIRANSIDEALALLEQHPNASLLAGGHSLLPAMKLRLANPEILIDIGRLEELKGITSTPSHVRIGALATHADIAASDLVPAGLREAAGMVGDRQVRNRGTIGGNISHADPASDLPTILTALRAKFHLSSTKGSRTLEADQCFLGFFETAKGKNEILLAVEVPTAGVSAYEKMPNPASGYCMVGAGAWLTFEGGRCHTVSVVVGGLTPCPTRCSSVEAELVGKTLDNDTIAAAARKVEKDLPGNLIGDIHASEDYRRAMASVYVKRVLKKVASRI